MNNFFRILIIFFIFSSKIAFSDPYGTLLGNFNNINVYSNGTSGNVSNEYNYVNGTNTGMKWQCVEYVNRYYLSIYNMNIRIAGHNAVDYYPNASARGLSSYPNNGTISPQVGDLLCFSGNTYGHVAIVREVGANYLKVAQQNVSNSASDVNYNVSMSVSSGHYGVSGSSIGSNYVCQGWLRKPATVSCNFTVNNGNNLNGWIFWKYPPMPVNFYTVSLTISNLPVGNNWALYIAKSSGNIAQIAANQSGTTYTFQFAVSVNDPLFPNGGGYFFKVTPQGQPNTSWCESSQFSISSLPTLSVNLNPIQQTYTIGQQVTVTWPISGGLGGQYGGLTGNIRLQFYQNNIPLSNIITVPITNNSYVLTIPSSIQGGTVPGCGYQIAGSIQDGNAPNGYVFAFSNPTFCISPPTGIIKYSENIPNKYELYQNYPNPFNPLTNIQFDIPAMSFVSLKLYNIEGKEISELVSDDLNPGAYNYIFDATKFSSGIYIYKLSANEFIQTKKMILIK